MSETEIRHATDSDVPSLLDIYNHYILHTPVTFEVVPRTLEQRRNWFSQFSRSGRHQCFVACEGGSVVGWVSSARFKERAAYDTTVEASIYLAPAATGRGLGRRLYCTLFEAIAGEDIHRVFAGVALPNDASVALHKSLGFRLMGVQPEVGRKFGRFWDVAQFFKNMD
jgi:phosphinothricin acetyltransferase